jgi:hypothetical protein
LWFGAVRLAFRAGVAGGERPHSFNNWREDLPDAQTVYRDALNEEDLLPRFGREGSLF